MIKAGVAVHDDIRFLKGVKKFDPSGFIDLQSFVKDFGIQSSGLKKLAAIVLGFRISNGSRLLTGKQNSLLKHSRSMQQPMHGFVIRFIKSLQTDMMFKTIIYLIIKVERIKIVLKSGKEQSVRRYHPWIFSGAIKKIYGILLKETLLMYYDNKDAFLAVGHYQPVQLL